ncbi:hypothetical protein ABE41_004610 [Fictibacillus arsenicus]|uniref:DUF4440 domain-containing protein n=1 Tax=Fictibacillus arsenicus TaxID=255247 RepID=A0A1B1Z1D0_9BACL|nr:hypothetical protein [Fictibacillus arsenicus]ANX11277.1 hypothetical protein ABE41_004610 [Fictibacillus arsenicus]
MKNFRKVIWIVTGFFLVGFSFLFGPDLLVKFQANQQASQFLKHAANQNFDDAFEQIYFFNGAYDEDVTITEDAAKKSWIKRNKQLFTEGTYIKSYENLKIRTNDGWPSGNVDLVMVENGKGIKYKDVYLAFNKRDKWKIGIMQSMHERDWEKAFSGHVVQ